MPTTPPAQPPARTCRFSWLGWIVAAGALLAAALLAARMLSLATVSDVAQTELDLARAENKGLRQQLEAERILARHQIAALRKAAAEEPAPLLLPLTGSGAAAITDSPIAWVSWQPASQKGRIALADLTTPPAGKEYRLWIMDKNGSCIPAGVVAPAASPDDGVCPFTPAQPVAAPARFVLSCEDIGATLGAPTAALLSGAL